MAHLIPRQTGVYSAAYSGCTWQSYNEAASSCNAYGNSAYPTCHDYLSDYGCCNSLSSWETSIFSCLQTVYGSCFDLLAYESLYSSAYPCYTNDPSTAPQSVAAQTTASPVPALVLEPITTGPPTAAPTYSPLSSYSGQGDLLQDYCTTPDYVLLNGPTAYWAPVVGCAGGKSDCCPYAVQSATSTSATTVYVVSTVTVDVGPSSETQAPYAGSYAGFQAYPTPVSSNQATLAHCPGDYVSVSGGCCPSGYQLWNAPLGGQIPCYSSLSSYLVPPAVPVSNYEQQITVSANITRAAASSSTTEPNLKPTSAIVNIVYAVQFLVMPSSGLSTGAKAGIGVSAGLGGIAIIILFLLLVRRTRKHKKDLTAMQQREGQIANDQSQNGMSEATSPYAYSQRTEFEAYGAPQVVLTLGGFVPQEQNSYFQQQQMQQGYGQQPAHQMQGQLPVQYPSPLASTVSPQPTSSDSYGQQTGYAGTIPSSIGSPPLQGLNAQGGYNSTRNELHRPWAQELNTQNPPGEMNG